MMSDFTTIQITKEVKDKLNILKSVKGLKYNDIIKELLPNMGGATVNDVICIEREKVALTLNYMETETNKHVKHDITYYDLKKQDIGTVFTPNKNPADDNFINSIAEIAFKKDDDVILLVKELHCAGGVVDSISSVVHVKLF